MIKENSRRAPGQTESKGGRIDRTIIQENREQKTVEKDSTVGTLLDICIQVNS